jgi:hypothetical protein
VVSIDRTLLKGEAPRFSADFVHPLSRERPFKCRGHLIQDLDMINQFLITVQTSGSGLFQPHTDISNSAKTLFGEHFQWRYEILKLGMS